MKRKHKRILDAIFSHPVNANIRWDEIESLLKALGADIEEREGSRIVIIFPDNPPVVFHRPHPSPMADKGAIAYLRNWLDTLGYGL